MKKIFLVLISFTILLSLCGCNTKHLTVEQTKNNFAIYEDLLNQVADNYNLELIETQDIHIENQDSYRDYLLNVNANSVIEIRIINSAYGSDKGNESFNVDYTIDNADTKNEMNIPLFVDLVNCISAKNISVDFCGEFLDAPESKYSSEKYGHKKTDDEIISKQYALNFFEDWNIIYTLTTAEEVLTFGGLTQEGCM